MARRPRGRAKACGNLLSRGIFASDSALIPWTSPDDAPFMTFLSTAQHFARGSRELPRPPDPDHGWRRGCGGSDGAGRLSVVADLGTRTPSSGPARLPVSIGATLFNVPTAAIRMKIQRHSGPQERVDLSFIYPSLEAPEAPKHVSADIVEEAVQPIDRIFLSIAAHHDTLAPDIRVRTIYPRYLEQASTRGAGGIDRCARFATARPIAAKTCSLPTTPELSARCTRDAATPGMCLSERRIDDADLTFRFPRSWLAQWRDVAAAMDRLTVQLHGPANRPSS